LFTNLKTEFTWNDVPDLILQSADSGVLLYLIITGFVISVWRLFLYYKEDRFFPKIEFFCDVLFKAEKEDTWLVEMVCVVRNKGISGHKVQDLKFRIHGLKDTDKLEFGSDAINGQLNFPHLIKEGKWKIRPAMNERVEANTAQFYRHVTYVGKDFKALVAYGSMRYRQRRLGLIGRRVTHTCNRLIEVPQSLEEARSLRTPEHLNMKFELDN